MARAGARILGTAAAALLFALGSSGSPAAATVQQDTCITAPVYPPTSGTCDPDLPPTTATTSALAADSGGLAKTGSDLAPILRAACLVVGVGALARHEAKRRRRRAASAT